MNQLIIEPGTAEKHYWRDLWRYRELFCFLAWRDVLVRYKQTIIGVAWAILRPFLMMVAFTFVFQRIAKLPSAGNAPYPLLVFAALLPWQFFATTMVDCSNSLVNNSNLISKIYFPRLIVPTGAVITGFVDFTITFALLLLLMPCFGYWPDLHLLALPIFTLSACCVSLSVGIWFSALTVRYRDMRYVVPFLAQFGVYVSPVGFSSALVPEHWRLLYSLNPMVGVIDGFRWSILRGQPEIYWPSQVASMAISILVMAASIRYFRKTEKGFADVI